MTALEGRILVFAGAGASKAVRSDMFPTTQEFFDDLLPPVTEQPLFKTAVNFLKHAGNTDKVDIEQVLWALQELYKLFDNISGSKDIAGYAMHNGLIESFYGKNHSPAAIINISGGMCDHIARLISEINQAVYELYGYEPTVEELRGSWSKLIESLDGLGKKLDIFTTNYDVVIEAALNAYEGEVSAREWRGIRGGVRQTLDLSAWTEAAGKSRGGLLTKLHGSLDWKRRGDQIYVGDPVFTGDHAKQAIIYPGFKGSSDASFFTIFHNYLADSIADSDLLIFIGFAFRDEHINQIIRENIRPSAAVYVLNPDRGVKFPTRRSKVNYMHEGFDSRAVKEIIGAYDS